MRYNNDTLLNATSLTTTFTSDAFAASYLMAASAQLTTTGNLVGNLYIQASNDPKNPTNWSTISTNGAFSGAGTIMIPKIEFCNQFIRFKIVYTSGIGVATLNVNTFGV